MRKQLADIVVAEGLVDEARVAAAEKSARRAGEPLIVALVELEHVAEVALVAALGRHLRVPLVELAAAPIEPDALREVSHELARRRRLLPLALEHHEEGPRTLRVAMADPTDRDAIAEIEISTGCQVVPVLATLSGVDEAVTRAYRGLVTAVMGSRRVPFGGDLAVATPGLTHGPSTEPFHQMEEEAALELRHRALLDVLVEKGVLSLDEYREQIRRLLKRDD